ncbi:MAG: plasmid partitioning protein RepB C-terminal domain-containing protein [Myxococcota bacterium]|jgi:ParB family chromosome partitioning protein|nr:plasmid partitioning protein RepB C-terminal domain-containing protein [Myxococcota bacterium]
MKERRQELPGEVQLIPLERIRVLNPRARDPKRFKTIVENISHVGLKKPITVSPGADSSPANPIYDLVCGQGRLEAYHALGETEIPAIIVAATKEDRLVMGLVENLARRQPARFEHVVQMVRLRDQGYSTAEIAAKVDLTSAFVWAALNLWDKGEERLLQGVELGRIPLSMACALAQGTDVDEQRVLTEAYESGKLTGKKLLKAKRLLEQRRNHGKKLRPIRGKRKPASADALVRTYKEETQRQRNLVKKARLCEFRLKFIVSAVKQLATDEDFVNLLRAEKLVTMPKYLAEQAGLPH